MMPKATHSKLAKLPAIAIALSLGTMLAGCGGMPTDRSLYSTKQPVIERTNFTLDVQTNRSGLPISEQQRVDGWFDTMELAYGDRISIDDPTNNPALKTAVSDLAGRYGLLVSATAPTTAGFLNPGQARIVITRSNASVPGCPDWSATSDMNYNNATSPNYGCATNSNLAAMIADPLDLLEGKKGSGESVVASGTKAIDTFRDTAPSGAGGLPAASTGGN